MSQKIAQGTAVALFIGLGVVGALGVSCNNPTITTPTRNLDRPSDVALYCVDLEVPNCLPDPNEFDPDLDPQGYLDKYCDQSTIDIGNNNQPIATVLTLQECDEDHRSQRDEDYLKNMIHAARLTGRDPNYPCCDPDNQLCGAILPTCARRMLAAVITNTDRGELAVADTQSQPEGLPTIGRLENLHGGQPGFGFMPVGLLPAHVRSLTPPGPVGASGRIESPNAWAVTSNAGSCDLSTVGLNKIAQQAAQPTVCYEQGDWCPSTDCTPDSCPQRVQPYLVDSSGQSRPLVARPDWLEIPPWSQQRRAAIVAYPTCGLVVSIDLGCADPSDSTCDQSTTPGRVLEGVAFDPTTGQPNILTAAQLAAIQCPADCGGDTSTSLAPNPQTLPDGGVLPIATYPSTLAIEPVSQRLIIGDNVGTALTVVDFDSTAADGSRFKGPPRRIPIDFTVLPESVRGGQPGLEAIRVTSRTASGQFAYVVARDSTVRVVDLDREVECETNPDPRYLQAHAGDIARVLPDELNDSNLRRLSCFPVGPDKTPRNPMAISAGISLPNGSLPRDLGFVHLDANTCDVTDPVNCGFAPDATYDIWISAKTALWVGDFGWILGGAGTITAFQVADACPLPSYRACFANSAALRRVSFLSTPSQYQPSPGLVDLPSANQAMLVTPMDRRTNVRRIYSRFEDGSPYGPRTDADSFGLPIFNTQALGEAVAYFQTINDQSVANGRTRLLLPAPAPYYYLPVEPVCDVALQDHALSSNFGSPDGVRAPEPTHRPVAMAQFTDPLSVNDSTWYLDWEGVLPGYGRSTGRMLSDGTVIDLNGLFCNHGVETGDKVWFTGCLSNNDCLNGETCRRESTQGIYPGICLDDAHAQQCRTLSQNMIVDTSNNTVWAATWLRRYRINLAEQQVPAITGDIADRLTMDEIPEPEFELEREPCANLDDACPNVPIIPPGQTIDVTQPWATLRCRAIGHDSTGALEKSCILECKANSDCGVGFVCAHSHYDAEENKALGLTDGSPRNARCMRAPLFTDPNILAACFPDPMVYEIHAGDSMLVHGDNSGAPSLVERGKNGACQRPAMGDPAFAMSRLLEPRLHLGPRDSLPDNDPQRCSTNLNDWILHRIPSSPEALAQPSCQSVRNVGSVQLPLPLNGTLNVVPGDNFRIQDATDKTDPWLKNEYELFSGLQLNDSRNQCILTGDTDEEYLYPDAARPNPENPRSLSYCYNQQLPGGGNPIPICHFPGDHTEYQGVRRIHFESPVGNLVMRVPQVLRDFTQPYSDCTDPRNLSNANPHCFCLEQNQKPCGDVSQLVCTGPDTASCSCKNGKSVSCTILWNPAVWGVPPEGYSVSISVIGGLKTYELPAQSAQRDVSSGVLAQGLRAATQAPSGALFLTDEGQSGSTTALRGQILRVNGSQMDSLFILR